MHFQLQDISVDIFHIFLINHCTIPIINVNRLSFQLQGIMVDIRIIVNIRINVDIWIIVYRGIIVNIRIIVI